MPDLADFYPGFASHWIDTSVGRIFARSGGEGPPLLLLHGYPKTDDVADYTKDPPKDMKGRTCGKAQPDDW